MLSGPSFPTFLREAIAMRTPFRRSLVTLLSCAWIALTPLAEAATTATGKTATTKSASVHVVKRKAAASKPVAVKRKVVASKSVAVKRKAVRSAPQRVVSKSVSTRKTVVYAKKAAPKAIVAKAASRKTVAHAGRTTRRHKVARVARPAAALAAGGALAYAGHAYSRDQAAPLRLSSHSAMVVDLDSDQVLFADKPDTVRPIASISKLMTAVVTLDAQLPMEEVIPVVIHDTKELQGVYSRVRVNSEISRKEMLRLALMSSENRAAAALAHNYPGGHARFVEAMNAKARALGMTSTHYVEPTGLSEHNVSTARDLVRLLRAARQYPMIRELSTTPSKTATFQHPSYVLGFNNTNPLTRNPAWRIEVTKTGFINEAGHCLALLAHVQNRPVAMVLLDTTGKHSHIGDATRVRRWLETGRASPVPAAAQSLDRTGSMTADR